MLCVSTDEFLQPTRSAKTGTLLDAIDQDITNEEHMATELLCGKNQSLTLYGHDLAPKLLLTHFSFFPHATKMRGQGRRRVCSFNSSQCSCQHKRLLPWRD